MSGYVPSPIAAQSLLYQILRVKFQLLQPDFLYLFLIGQMRSRRQILQLMRIVGVLLHQVSKILVRLHQVRFQLFLCVSIHPGIPPRVRLPRRVDHLD